MTDPLTTTLAIIGGITFYGGELFEGSHLACPGNLWYACDSSMGPWGAFPLEWFEDGRFQ
jgi:hypothetical protein